jgi:hypothetical protein
MRFVALNLIGRLLNEPFSNAERSAAAPTAGQAAPGGATLLTLPLVGKPKK